MTDIVLCSDMDQQSEFFPDSFARISVKGLYLKDGKILLCKDETAVPFGKGAFWELPGGGWDFGETFEETFKREAMEEMGLEVSKISNQPIQAWPVKRERSSRLPSWYYVLMLLFRVEFKDFNFTPSSECTEIGFFTWEEFQKLENLLVQSQPLKELLTKGDFETI